MIVEGLPRRLLGVPVQYEPRDLPCQAGTRRDETIGVAFYQFIVDSRFVVKTFGVGEGREFQKVFITGLVFCQHHQVIIAVLILTAALFSSRTGGNIKLIADNRLYSDFPAGLVEL